MEREKPQVDRVAGIAYWRAPADFEGHHFEAYLRALVKDPSYSVGFQEIMDFRRVSVSPGLLEGVTQTVNCQRGYKNQFIGNQRALIAPGDGMFEFCRSYALRSDDLPMEIQAFREAEEAAMWLGIEPEIFQALPARWDQQENERCPRQSLTA